MRYLGNIAYFFNTAFPFPQLHAVMIRRIPKYKKTILVVNLGFFSALNNEVHTQ